MQQPLTKSTIGDLHLFIEKEAWNDDAEIPSYPVETGLDVSDHVKDKPNVVVLSGIIFDDEKINVTEKIIQIRKYKNEGHLLSFIGRRSGNNMLISRFSYNTDADIGNGHRFSLTLQEVRIAKKSIIVAPPAAQTATNSGHQQTQGAYPVPTYHVVKKGDTYIGMGRQYGVDWKQIKAWAGYPDRRIPIGVTVRVV